MLPLRSNPQDHARTELGFCSSLAKIAAPNQEAASGSISQLTGTRRFSKDNPLFGGEILRVIVGQGENARTFHAHESLVTKFSDFFKAAVKKGWSEAEQRTVKLPEDDPSHFQIFFSFLYTGRVFSCDNNPVFDWSSVAEWSRLAKLWILGDKLQSCAFKDAVVDALLNKLQLTNYSATDIQQEIYASTCSPSPMRELLVDIAAWNWSLYWHRSVPFRKEYSEFFYDLAQKQATYLSEGKPLTSPYGNCPPCKYHEHKELPCYKTMFPY